MVIYSGFSSRKQEDKYNGLIKQLLAALSQMIITYLQSSTLQPFRHHYQHLLLEFARMDAVKYSDFKVSLELNALTQHICAEEEQQAEWHSQPPKRKPQRKWKAKPIYSNTMQLTHNEIDHSKMHAKTNEGKNFRRRSLSITIDKNADKHIDRNAENRFNVENRYNADKHNTHAQTYMQYNTEQSLHAARREPTMEELMEMNPLFDKANRHSPHIAHRQRRFLRERQKGGSQAILQQDQFEMQADD